MIHWIRSLFAWRWIRSLFAWRWIRSLFAWRIVHDAGVHLYCQNTVTGKRRIVKGHGCYQPINWHWLETGEWETFDITKVPNMSSTVNPAPKV